MIPLHQNRPAFYIHQLYTRFASTTSKIVIKDHLPAIAYQPQIVERHRYARWEKDGFFKADGHSRMPIFSMILPPPNITGKLHLGHALTCTVQDVIARRRRSMGEHVLWLPGMDHAGIATQTVVEKYLKNVLNTDRQNLTREAFNSEVWKWKEMYENAIRHQLRTMGCSLDWSRETFTMSPTLTNAVNTAFLQLFEKGLIYRKKTLVNWCNALQSTVSDIEVENKFINGPTDIKLHGYSKPVKFGQLYNFAYKIFGTNDEVVVSTTMPETMMGDTAIAVHPQDQRYNHLVSKRALHPFRNRTIPIILDEFVDKNFGTGAVKITPAHSKVDYEVARRHNLPTLEVIGEDGLMRNCDQFNNLPKYECREAIVKKLDELSLLKGVKSHQMFIPVCSRTGDIIDYILKDQWFLSCSELNKRAEEVVLEGHLKIEPEKFTKNWFDWTRADKDWCISRQLWWGHQIPAYKCSAGRDEVWVPAMDETTAKKEASKILRAMPDEIVAERDTDVLDTWFSSGIYPFAALGWPKEQHQDLRVFYPLSLMATGHDILGFWVHRMVILGLELTGRLPFKQIFLHGVICDNKGAKMSKSKGNVIDPIDIIKGITIDMLKDKAVEQHKTGIITKDEMNKAITYHKSTFSKTNGIPECGLDALRFTLLSQDVKSHYVSFDVDQCYANKLFCNKIWQSVNYLQICINKLNETKDEITLNDITYFDIWILSRLANMVEIVNKAMDNYDFHIATKALRTLIYKEFCDVYVEATKPAFAAGNQKAAFAHAHTLSAVLNTSLRCLNPFMIYLTEAVIPHIPAFQRNIICNFNDLDNKYFDIPQPEVFESWRDKIFEKNVERVIDTINLVRELKGLYKLSSKSRPWIKIKTWDDSLTTHLQANSAIVASLTKCAGIDFDKAPFTKKYVRGFLDKETEVSIEVLGDDIENTILEAREKLQHRINKLHETLERLEAKCTSERYITSVPEWTQLLDREKLNSKKQELIQLKRLIE